MFEYYTEYITASVLRSVYKGDRPNKFDLVLNARASEGWELVSYVVTGIDGILTTFRRPLR
jgi:hypothetical protein